MANPQIQSVIDSMFSKFLPWIIVLAVLGGIAESLKGKRSRARRRQKSSSAEALVLMPWWVSVVLALLVYIFLPRILPPAIGNAWVGIIVLFLLAMAAISALRSWKTRQLLERQTSIESIRELPWKRFEDLLGEAYRRQGYKVTETLGCGPDGGVDLVLSRAGEMILVQAKCWKQRNPVPVQTVRELYGVLHHRGASAAKLVATTNFTSQAIAFARDKPIELVDARALLSLLRGVQTSGCIAATPTYSDHLTPVCPKCGSGMVQKTARKGPNAGGKFWGCPRWPECCGRRPIG